MGTAGPKVWKPDVARPAEALDVATVADLADDVVAAMTEEELIRVIESCAELVPCGMTAEELRLRDRACLMRLAQLARHAAFLTQSQVCRAAAAAVAPRRAPGRTV